MERGDSPEVGAVVGRQPPKGDIVYDSLGNLASGRDAHAISVKHDREHHGQVKGRATLAVVSEEASPPGLGATGGVGSVCSPESCSPYLLRLINLPFSKNKYHGGGYVSRG